MRPITEKMQEGWEREDKTGEYRPHVRVTIQRVQLQRFPYNTKRADGGDWEHQRYRKGQHTSVIFGDDSRPIELRGIKSFSWNRSLDQDVATATLEMINSEIQVIGQEDPDPERFDFGSATTLVAAAVAVVSAFYLPGNLLGLVHAAARVVGGAR